MGGEQLLEKEQVDPFEDYIMRWPWSLVIRAGLPVQLFFFEENPLTIPCQPQHPNPVICGKMDIFISFSFKMKSREIQCYSLSEFSFFIE